MKASPRSRSRSRSNFGGKHFGKFHEEVFPRERASLFNAKAIRHECVSTFSKLRTLRHGMRALRANVLRQGRLR